MIHMSWFIVFKKKKHQLTNSAGLVARHYQIELVLRSSFIRRFMFLNLATRVSFESGEEVTKWLWSNRWNGVSEAGLGHPPAGSSSREQQTTPVVAKAAAVILGWRGKWGERRWFSLYEAPLPRSGTICKPTTFREDFFFTPPDLQIDFCLGVSGLFKCEWRGSNILLITG